jgi:chromatin remodeling complex protein RSC6
MIMGRYKMLCVRDPFDDDSDAASTGTADEATQEEEEEEEEEDNEKEEREEREEGEEAPRRLAGEQKTQTMAMHDPLECGVVLSPSLASLFRPDDPSAFRPGYIHRTATAHS